MRCKPICVEVKDFCYLISYGNSSSGSRIAINPMISLRVLNLLYVADGIGFA